MTEPRIQYAKTSDGVSIACWTLGEELPLVLTYPVGFSNIQLEWKIPSNRRMYERQAQYRMLVRYEPHTLLEQTNRRQPH